MKTLITILILCLSISVLAQEPVNDSLGGRIVWREQPFIEKQERAKDRFPSGFNPDGQIGSISLMVMGGYTSQSNDWRGYHIVTGIELPTTRDLTIFLHGQFFDLRYYGPLSSLLSV